MSILAPSPDLAAALMAAALEAMLDGRDDDARTLLQQAQGGARAAPRAQTPGGLPFPILADPPHVPADIQALAEAVEARLETATARAHVHATRGVNGSGSANAFVDVTPAALSLPAAPAGLYQASAVVGWRSDGSGTNAATLRLMVNGSFVKDWVAQTSDSLWRVSGLHYPVEHPGGPLSIQWRVRLNMSPFTVSQDSTSTLTRISI